MDGLISKTTSPIGEPVNTAPPPALLKSPLNDIEVWNRAPMYDPPSGVDIKQCQQDIDNLYGVTRDNQPILKLVWSGDRQYWRQTYMSWDVTGQPDEGIVRRSLLRFKTIRDQATGKFVRDVFPPRWLILCRLEPEQFPRWREESWMQDGVSHCKKLIRPKEPPPVYWLWYATIAHHNSHCCATAERERYKCYGEYAPPSYIYETLGRQKEADKSLKYLNPYQEIDASTIFLFDNVNNNHYHDLMKLKVQSEVAIENPMAYIGPVAAMKAGIRSVAQARDVVKEFFDREIEKTAAKAAKVER